MFDSRQDKLVSRLTDEQLSAIYDGEMLPHGTLPLDEESCRRTQSWSVIGAALRGELGTPVAADFAQKVAAAVAAEPVPQVDQADGNRHMSLKQLLRRCGVVLTQTAIAASVAVVTVVGWQTYTAQDNLTLQTPAMASLDIGQHSQGVNLASYQVESNGNVVRGAANQSHGSLPQPQINDQNLQRMRNQEAERINLYLNGYVVGIGAGN